MIGIKIIAIFNVFAVDLCLVMYEWSYQLQFLGRSTEVGSKILLSLD